MRNISGNNSLESFQTLYIYSKMECALYCIYYIVIKISEKPFNTQLNSSLSL